MAEHQSEQERSTALASLLAKHHDTHGVWPSCTCGWMDYRPRVSPLMTHDDHLAEVVERIVAERLADLAEQVRKAVPDAGVYCDCDETGRCAWCSLHAVIEPHYRTGLVGGDDQ